ncbi:phosphopantetheine-binding protein [Kitasatospora kazusensis]|uniref:Phosphopantetheine-binding protein n=1 Tax=Kitasatospora kazusensis TaxID=407974 RepID=A0ABP5KVJ6_9ACTN
MTDTYDRLATLLVDKFDVAPGALSPGASFADLDFDSLAVIELFVTIQEQWQVPLDDTRAVAGLTLGEVTALVDDFTP